MGRLLGLDYGRKRVGVAVTDELRMVASPLVTLVRDAAFEKELIKIHERYSFDAVIVGYPHSETYREAAREAEVFGEQVSGILKLPVYYQNEEFTTVYMTSFLKSLGYKDKEIKEKIDRYAAQKILEDYLKRQAAGVY